MQNPVSWVKIGYPSLTQFEKRLMIEILSKARRRSNLSPYWDLSGFCVGKFILSFFVLMFANIQNS